MRQVKNQVKAGVMALALAFAQVIMPVAPAFATSTNNGGNGGNELCPDGTVELAKFNLQGNSYVKELGNFVTVTGNGIGGTYAVSGGHTVSDIVIKGANDAVTVEVNPSATQGSFSNEVLPLNNGGQRPAISNIKFCETPVQTTNVTAVSGTFADLCGLEFNASFIATATTGVIYNAVTIGNTIVVTATANQGYTLLNPSFSQTYTDKLVACPPEDESVIAVNGTFSDVCGDEFNLTFIAAQTEGVTYTQTRNGNEIRVTATANEGYVLSNPEWSQTQTDKLEACPVTATPVVCPEGDLTLIRSTDQNANGWTVPSNAEYLVEGGLKLNVEGNWDQSYIYRDLPGTLADIGSVVKFEATPEQYVGIHVETTDGRFLTYEYGPGYDNKWWSTSDFGVESGQGYKTFDTLENIVAANPDVKTSTLYVLYTHPEASSTVITSVTIGCTEYVFNKTGGSGNTGEEPTVPTTPVVPATPTKVAGGQGNVLPEELPMTGQNGSILSTWIALLAAILTYGSVYYLQPKKRFEQ